MQPEDLGARRRKTSREPVKSEVHTIDPKMTTETTTSSCKSLPSAKCSGGFRLGTFFILALMVLCLLLVYNLYDVMSQRDVLHEDLNDARVKVRMCNKESKDWQKRHVELEQSVNSKQSTETERLQLAEQQNAQLNAQLQNAVENYKLVEGKNQEWAQYGQNLEAQLNDVKSQNQQLLSEFQVANANSLDAQNRLNAHLASVEAQNAEIIEARTKLAAYQQEVETLRQANEAQRQAYDTLQTELTSLKQQAGAKAPAKEKVASPTAQQATKPST